MAELGVKAGKIAKPYGLRGEVQLILLPHCKEYLQEGTFMFIDMDGQKVPFFMEKVELLSGDQAIVKFEFIDDKEEARKIAGCELCFDHRQKISKDEGTAGLLSLSGYMVIDEHQGELGPIREIMAQASNPLWLIQGDGDDILIPATEDFIKKIDHRKKLLFLDLPEGLTAI